MSFYFLLNANWDGMVADLRGMGRHVDLKGNLIKAMMVMNWLNMLEVERF